MYKIIIFQVHTFHSFGAVLLPSGHDRGDVTSVRQLVRRTEYFLQARHDGARSTRLPSARGRRKFACNNHEQH
jgi:hypothetical protein